MRKNFIYTLIIVILLSSISCTSPNNPDNNNNDTTKWKDYTNYPLLQQIWQGTPEIFQYKDAENVYQGSLILYGSIYGGDMKYTMAIESITWISDTEGIMYGKYSFHMVTPSLKNKYYAIAFRNLTASSVDFSEASLTDKQYTETLEEAQTTFTIESGAFSTYKNYTIYSK